jgi:enoyl-CoA hydratase/carnithine racemase
MGGHHNDGEVVISECFEDGILRLTLNRPSKLNAVNYAVVEALLEELHAASTNPSIRAVLLMGAGRSFCAGDDVVSQGELPRPLAPGENPVRAMQQLLMRRWFWLRKPTIVAVQGHCYGFGFDLALAADFRVVCSTASMGDIRIRRAMPVGSGGTFLLPLLVGLPAATSIMMRGESLSVEQIERLGLASRSVQPETFEAEAMEFARTLACGPTKAMGIVKFEMRRNLGRLLEDALDLELDLISEPVEDREEGRRAFAERRDPRFRGV